MELLHTDRLFHPNLGVFPLHQIAYVGVSQRISLMLAYSAVKLFSKQPIPTQNCNHYYLRNGKATTFKFSRYIHRSDQKTIKNFGKSSRGRTQGLFRAPIAYIGRIARSSLR